MKVQFVSWREIDKCCNKLALQILKSDWRPDYIVGIGRGGLPAAVILSHLLEKPMYSLKVTLRDGVEEDCDHNCWMAEDAFGYGEMGCLEVNPMNILILDDINDSGATIEWIKKDWPAGCLPNSEAWDKVWHNNVKFAVLVNNLASKETVDFTAMEINKEEEPVWIHFPWEHK
jgi:xanthine phosphoribosyltransferase